MYQFETKIKIITNTNSIQTFFHLLTLDHTYHNTLKSIESFNSPISSLLITPLPPSSSPYQPVLITHSYKRRAWHSWRPSPGFFQSVSFYLGWDIGEMAGSRGARETTVSNECETNPPVDR